MEQNLEIEIKLKADGLSETDFLSWVVAAESNVKVESVSVISGTDRFWRKNDDVVRHRCDGPEQHSVLTVKKRKSAESLVNRFEVDLPIQLGTAPETVDGFLRLAGYKHEFGIFKNYWVVKAKGPDYHTCIALYDVWGKTYSTKKRFLEVEIERASGCDSVRAEEILKEWQASIDRYSLLPNSTPVNQSLYEIFSKEFKTINYDY